MLEERNHFMSKIIDNIVFVDPPKSAEDCPYSKYWLMTSKHECILLSGMFCRCKLEIGDKCPFLKEEEE